MRLSKLRIENFRSFKDEAITFDKYTCLVGPNGCGKSTVLMALNVFFRNAVEHLDMFTLTKDDFHHGDISRPIKITLTFEDLNEKAKVDFKEYYRQNQLVISAKAEWDETKQNAKVGQCGSRLIMKEFSEFFGKKEAGANAEELKSIYNKIREKFTELPISNAATKMEIILRNYEEAHREQCTLNESTQEFYGFTGGSDRLPDYISNGFMFPQLKMSHQNKLKTRKQLLGCCCRELLEVKLVLVKL